MSEPMTKKRLANYPALKTQIENHLERLARMKSNEIMPAMQEGDGSQHTPSASDRMANAIIKRLSYQERSAERIREVQAEMEAIEDAIDSLPDPVESEVMRMRYIDGECSRPLPWRDVSIRMYGDDDENHVRTIHRIHERALQNIRKGVEYDTETICKAHDGERI